MPKEMMTVERSGRMHRFFLAGLVAAMLAFPIQGLQAQSSTQSGGGNQSQNQPSGSQSPSNQPPANQPPANQPAADDIPDAPSAVQPPTPKTLPQTELPPNPLPDQTGAPADSAQQDQEKQAPPKMPPVQTIAPGSAPRNQIDATQNLYKISVTTNFVQIPVTVKDHDGRRVDGLLPQDFTVLENGKPQKLTYFTSDPFQLSVAIVLDLGVADVALRKIDETYASLVGAFSPYDEFALYTYSSTVNQIMDFTSRPQKLTAALNEIKPVRGQNGVPVLNGPFTGGPTVNGMPAGGPPVAPVNTPPRQAHVLNDAILQAAIDLSKRDRTRRKVILVISDGRELGSTASYRQVLHLLQSRDIQVKAVVVDSGALPVFKQLEKFHLPGQGYGDILPRYSNATGGGEVWGVLSRNAIEDAYTEITSEARNQYTLGYSPKAIAGSAPYRGIEVQVDKKGLNIYTKAGYYPIPSMH